MKVFFRNVVFTYKGLSENYIYYRFRWTLEIDLDKLAKMLHEESFEVKRHNMPTNKYDIALRRKYRDYLYVKADTLVAALSHFSATLSQKEKKAFTKKDMKLRQIVLDTYPNSTSTPIPVGHSFEPKFEVEEENNSSHS
jgi:hypothetical protein